MKTFLKVLSLIYLSLLFYIFFLARRRPSPHFFNHFGEVNLIPFRFKSWYIRYFFQIPRDLQVGFLQDFLGNILIFIPFSFALHFLAAVRSSSKALLIALATSFSVELIQFLLGIGFADIDDILLNLLGAAIGCIILPILRKIFPGPLFV